MQAIRRMFNRKSRAFTLVEVVIAMAMVAVIAGAVTFTILAKIAEAKIQRGLTEIGTLEKGVASWVYRTGNTDYSALTGTSVLTSSGAVPAGLGSATANPWGGAYNVTGSGSSFTIEVTTVPASASGALLAAFGPRSTESYNSTTSVLTLQFTE
ncbi:MAG: type II secretion system protein [Candidatus Eiseniibacteriota bacterium]